MPVSACLTAEYVFVTEETHEDIDVVLSPTDQKELAELRDADRGPDVW